MPVQSDPQQFVEAALNSLPANGVRPTAAEQIDELMEQAERCRRLGATVYCRETTALLERLAEHFELTADELRKRLQQGAKNAR